MRPTRRDLRFKLRPNSVSNWHEQGPWLTQFVNAMSIFFPEGERYFIHTVRQYASRIKEPELCAAVSAFIGQEAMHGREHDEYNRLLHDAGLPSEALEKHVKAVLDQLRKHLPPAAQLSVTIAQEHFTAILSELVLTDPQLIAGADSRLEALWRWHALEETEHKAVAFDVYQTVVGRSLGAYVLRASGMVLTTFGFLGLVLVYQQRLLAVGSSGNRGAGFSNFARFMLLKPALIPRLVGPWLSYFRPGFHPWQHDNRHLLDELSELVAETKTYQLDAA